MNTVVFTVFGICVSVKNIIGCVILAAIFALCSYAVGFVIDAKHKVTAGFIAITSCVGVAAAIFWLIKFIGYCFS